MSTRTRALADQRSSVRRSRHAPLRAAPDASPARRPHADPLDPPRHRWARPLAAAALVIVASAGIVREWRTASLVEPFSRGLTVEPSAAELQAAAAAVAQRFADVRDHGPRRGAPPWPLHTSADYLEQGGSCGDAAAALGTVLDHVGIPFRIVQVNVLDWGASHVMVEAQDADGRWLLLAPLTGFSFTRPATGQALTLRELRVLPKAERGWLPREYREEWSLFGVVRRTNWDGMGPLNDLAVLALGDEEAQRLSLRAVFLEPGHEVAVAAAVALAVLLGRGRTRRRRPLAAPH